MSHGVAPDGSPVEVYVALPAGDTPRLIDSQIQSDGSILELGSGPGRITHPLLALGHDVLAVDDSPEMLARVRGAETLLADLFSLDMGRVFDAVVAGSHLINSPEPSRRLSLLSVCRRHVREGGVVLIERYAPEWAADPRPGEAKSGEVHIVFEPIALESDRFAGRVTYELKGRSWVQDFVAANVSEEMLRVEASSEKLAFSGWIDDAETWARLEPVELG